MEALTDEVEAKAWELINKIDALGGSVSAIEQGFIQDAIARSAYEYQKKIESGEKVIVGVNKFTVKDEAPIPGFKIDDSIRTGQVQKLKELRARRDSEKVRQCLADIEQSAKDGRNLMPFVITAVENLCTLGEVSDVLRKVFGEYR